MFWLSMPHGMTGRGLPERHARYADLREVRYTSGVVLSRGIADNERVKGTLQQ